ncbi:signal transduction protein (EAL/GGDEF domain protein) [Legionella busanensis]|uniref:Signal transduction protein (EAL/GGDEF domain protein) n=1 Tax=Legionella busanensis TaxID=190655 RepID=A0A378JKV1_9GAMM|nr:EAL domain-containing protein [Legionella busanensis]STX51956.1 signal transduction protein (EAL/GGDEF domain protein) [Legionella busanensis]
MTQKVNFSYAYQPIVDVINRVAYSYEALIRGPNNEPPTIIFAQVSRISLPDFDQQAREFAIKLAVQLGLTCNINLNFLPNSLSAGSYIDKTLDALNENNLNPDQLIIEVPESEIIHHQQDFLYSVRQCRSKGIRIAIDDFGAGYSGLNLLLNLQPDLIKLDMQLIRKIDANRSRQAVVKAILEVCRELNIKIIAEGVENLSEYEWLAKEGISLFQGYLLSKPGFQSLPAITFP